MRFATGTSHRRTRVARGAGALRAFAAASLLAAACAGDAMAREDIAGIWFDDTGRGAIEIVPCGAAACGRVVWLRQPRDSRGEPLRDHNNPVPKQRDRPICGMPVIWGLRPQADGSWDNGRIYDPKVGKSYDVAVTRIGAGRLRITGYLGTKLFSRDLIWQRAPAELPRCSAN